MLARIWQQWESKSFWMIWSTRLLLAQAAQKQATLWTRYGRRTPGSASPGDWRRASSCELDGGERLYPGKPGPFLARALASAWMRDKIIDSVPLSLTKFMSGRSFSTIRRLLKKYLTGWPQEETLKTWLTSLTH
jgi:hypothetical protein